jgi:RHS repeat-associated protein
MDGLRIATVAPSGNICYYHNNHLETPEKMTNESGAVVWKADYKPFGEATVDSSSTVVNNFRFPGQYYDSESGLHYNWNRYYDPTTGRYLTADPIGLKGGLNLYVYVLNNSINRKDPEGLKPFYGNVGLVIITLHLL